MKTCELCLRPVAEDRYHSDPRVDTSLKGRGLVLHEKCAAQLAGMSDKGALNALETMEQRGKRGHAIKMERFAHLLVAMCARVNLNDPALLDEILAEDYQFQKLSGSECEMVKDMADQIADEMIDRLQQRLRIK